MDSMTVVYYRLESMIDFRVGLHYDGDCSFLFELNLISHSIKSGVEDDMLSKTLGFA